jgi:hypothetical protein
VRALANAFRVCPHADPTGPAFAVPTHDRGMAPLTHRLFVETLRFCLGKIGVNLSEFSGHSFRRGGANFAHRMGVSPLLIKLMGDWSFGCVHGVHQPHHTDRPGPPASGSRQGHRGHGMIPHPMERGQPRWGRLPDLSVAPDVVTVHLNRLTHAFRMTQLR